MRPAHIVSQNKAFKYATVSTAPIDSSLLRIPYVAAHSAVSRFSYRPYWNTSAIESTAGMVLATSRKIAMLPISLDSNIIAVSAASSLATSAESAAACLAA